PWLQLVSSTSSWRSAHGRAWIPWVSASESGATTRAAAWRPVVGVIRAFRHYRRPQPMGPALYFPSATQPVLSQTLAIRTTLDDPLVLAPAVRAAVRELDADVSVYQVQTFEQVVTRSLWRQRLQGQALGIFAMLAVLLAVVGIYGVIS